MRLIFRLDRASTGKPQLVLAGECQWDDFPSSAAAVVDYFGWVVTDRIDGLEERMWLVKADDLQFCISWDVWFPEVSILAWSDTPDAELERLLNSADARPNE